MIIEKHYFKVKIRKNINFNQLLEDSKPKNKLKFSNIPAFLAGR